MLEKLLSKNCEMKFGSWTYDGQKVTQILFYIFKYDNILLSI